MYEYKRSECKELECDKNKYDDVYIRIELDDFIEINPISSVEYGTITVNYTTIYLLKNASTMHELYLKNRREIDVYKILKKVSEEKSLPLKKEKDGFLIGKDYVRVLQNRDIKINERLVELRDLLF